MAEPIKDEQSQEAKQSALSSLFGGTGVNVPELQKKMGELKKPTEQTPPVQTPEQTPAPTETVNPTETKPTETAKPTEEVKLAEKPVEEKIKSPFSKMDNTPQKFETQEDLLNYLNEETGTTNKDFQSFTKDFKAISENNDALRDSAGQAEQLTNYLTNLPEDIASILLVQDKGGDYREHMRDLFNQQFDFSIPFENQQEFKVLNHYKSDKFSSMEDYRTMKDDEPEKFRDYVDIVKSKYEGDKTKFDKQRTSAIAKVNDSNKIQTADYEKSLNESISYLNNEFSFNEIQKKEISRTLKGGSNAILSLFYDEKGFLKKEAAESLALIKYGKQEIVKNTQKVKNEATSKANEDIISRGKDTPFAEKPSSEASQSTRNEVVEDWRKKVIPDSVEKSVFD